MRLENIVLFAKILIAAVLVIVIHPNLFNGESMFEMIEFEKPALPEPMYSQRYSANSNTRLPEITSQYRHGVAHLGVEENHSIGLQLEEDWRFSPLNISIHGASKASPAVDDSGIYIGADSSWFYAITHDGKLKWKRFMANAAPGIHSTAALDEDSVYVAVYNGFLHKLDKESGAMLWSIDLGDAIGASVVLHDRYLYTAVETSGPPNGYVVCVDRITGKIVWRSPWLGEQAHSTPTLDLQRGRIYLGANNKQLFALSLQDGSILWQVDVGGEVKGTLALVDDLVIFASWTGMVEARSVEDGSQLWAYDSGAKSQSSASFVPGENLILIGSNSGLFSALDVATGKLRWRYDTGFGRLRASALVIRNRNSSGQYIAWMPCAAEALCAFDTRSGRILNKYTLSSHLTGVPVAFGDSLYVAQDESGGLIRLKNK